MKVCFLLLLFLSAGFAQKLDPAKWSLELEPSTAAPGSRVLGRLKATLEPGWHLYSLSTPPGGPIPTTLQAAPNPAVASFKIYQTKPIRAFDKNFGLDTETYEGSAEFLLDLEIAAGAPPGSSDVTAQIRYQLCDDTRCIPPVRKTATASLVVASGTPAAALSIPPGYLEFVPGAVTAPSDRQGLPAFLAIAFGFGLAAIFTPCVFPMIPITMSFLLNKPSGRLFQAALFCLGIVVLFTGLGLGATAILGPFGIVQIGSNPWVNGFVALIFLVFGLSMLGAFELTMPSGLLTKLDSASQRGGMAGTMLMGLTFSLTSFACVGPFVGPLLAASVAGGGATRPVLGMACFATGLALPFFLLALFPSYLKRLPKSGGWLARVKVVMGFILLAVMLKYLSSVDQVLQWNILTRERFLAAWIVLFSLPGLYLLGFLRLEGVGRDEPVSLNRLLAGTAFLIFSISLIPGMFGGRLGDLDAFVPLARESSGPLSRNEDKLAWIKNDYRGALEQARTEGKLVFVNFTGYACTNCHWMKANMFTRPEIAAAMSNFVLLELYTDGNDEASQANQELQEKRFATIAIPYYAILDAEERIVASFPGLTRKAPEFLAFLDKKL
ncbi:MAG: cytochrome c biogenesis protein CcdA [Bryobacteraceae bacterium]